MEFWQTPGAGYWTGGPEEIHVTREGDLLVGTWSASILKLDKDGNFLKSRDGHFWFKHYFGADDKVYQFGSGNGYGRQHIWDSDLNELKIIVLQPYEGFWDSSTVFANSKGKFFIAEKVQGGSGDDGLTRKFNQLRFYNKRGYSPKYVVLQKRNPQILSLLTHFFISPEDKIQAFELETGTLWTINEEGDVEGSIKLEGLEEFSNLANFRYDHQGNLCVIPIGSNQLLRWDRAGKLISQESLDLMGMPKNVVSFDFDRSTGEFYLAYENKRRINKYNADGSFQKTVFDTSFSPFAQDASKEAQKPYDAHRLAIGKDDVIYTVAKDPERIYKLSNKGQLLGSFPIKPMRVSSMQVGADNTVYVSCGKEIYGYNHQGHQVFHQDLESVMHKSIEDFRIAPNGEFFIVNSEELIRMKSNGHAWWIKLDKRSDDRKLSARSLAIDKESNIHILGKGRIYVYTAKGKLLRELRLKFTSAIFYTFPSHTNYLQINHKGQYLVGLYFPTRLYLFNKKGRELSGITPTMDYYVSGVVQDSKGRYYVGHSDWWPLVTSPMLALSTMEIMDKKKHNTLLYGEIKHNEDHDLYEFEDKLHIEVEHPDGTKYQGIVGISFSRFRIVGLPLGTKYRMWLNSHRYTTHELKRTVLSGTLDRARKKVNFRDRKLADNTILVHGMASNKYGLPLSGVAISNGQDTVFTNLEGNFILPLPAGSSQEITASREGYSFENPSRFLQIGKNDIFQIEFKEKK
jgi:hypothetical protein